MTNRKTIQVLRGPLSSKLKSTDTLAKGQPLYITDTNQLIIGGGVNDNVPIKDTIPITVQEMNQFDTSGKSIGRIYFETTSNELLIDISDNNVLMTKDKTRVIHNLVDTFKT